MNKLPAAEWDNRVEQDIINVVNYYLSGGSLKAAKEMDKAKELLADVLNDREARAHRQALGGVITEISQLSGMPGFSRELLERLALEVSGLDSDKLRMLAPQTTRHNRVDPYVNGPQCLEMILEEIGKARRYIHLSIMLFFNDHSGNLIAAALLQALERGVEVRIMVNYTVTALGYGKNLEVGKFSKISRMLENAGARLLDTFNSYYSAAEWSEKRAELKSRGYPKVFSSCRIRYRRTWRSQDSMSLTTGNSWSLTGLLRLSAV